MRFILAALITLAPAAAFALETAPTEARKVKEKKICKVVGQDTSSRLRKQVCRTVKEWDEAQESKTVEDLKGLIAY